jgi:hypothetical protein
MDAPRQNNLAPLGTTEPHAPLLMYPPDGQPLYKIMSIENLVRSITDSYLHFNRVDSYKDFPGADLHDGQQLPKDERDNAQTIFEKTPTYSAADYYNQSRTRTYACCFSLENSNFIWNNYANDGPKGKVCIVFHFGKLRETLNQMLQSEQAALEYNGQRCRQIFNLNYGIVEYVDWDTHQANVEHLPNPIIYTYLKDKTFQEEKEFRISLSALGMGHFALANGSIMDFPPRMRLSFDFRAAIADETIQQILYGPECDLSFLLSELQTLSIEPRQGSTPMLPKGQD